MKPNKDLYSYEIGKILAITGIVISCCLGHYFGAFILLFFLSVWTQEDNNNTNA